MLRRRTTITFEKLERCFYRLPDAEPVTAQCNGCGCEVSWLTPIQVVALTGISLRELFRQIEAEALHFHETGPGLVHVCDRSLGFEVTGE
jgi:hypothetical protein